jgi:hypothetical protein
VDTRAVFPTGQAGLSLESVGGHVLGLGAPHQNAFCSSR